MNPPITHLHQAIALFGYRPIMSRHHERDAFRRGKIQEKPKDGRAGVLIERAGGLVREKYLRLVHQRTAERGPLTFSTRKLLDTVAEPVA
jgi:hypothetical protein